MVDGADTRQEGEDPDDLQEFNAARAFAQTKTVWANFTLVSAILALLYALFAAAHLYFLSPEIRWTMASAAGISALLFALLRLYMRRSPPQLRFAHFIGSASLFVVLVNSALHLYLTGILFETSNFALIALACGLFLASTPWFLGTLILVLCTWLAIAADGGFEGAAPHFGFFLGQIALISLVTYRLRQRALDDLVRSQLANDRQRRELECTVEELAGARERLQQLSEATFEAVFLHQNGRIVDVNSRASELFGYSRADFQCMSMDALLAPEVRMNVPWGRKTLHSSTGAERDGRIHESVALHKNGNRFPIEFGSVHRRSGEITIDAAVVRDVSDRHRLEQRLRDFVENAVEFIYETDRHGNFTYLNSALARALCGGNELIGQDCNQYICPDDRPRILAEIAQQDFLVHPTLYQEFRVVGGEDEPERWVGRNIQAIVSQNRVVGYRMVARDITARIVAVRSAVAARHAAEEANRSKSRFLSSMSHELRTPLNGILGFAQLLQEEFHGPLNPQQREYVASLTDCSAHLMTLINDLLDLSKAEIGAIELNAQPLSLEAAVRSAVAMIRRDASEKMLDIRLEIPPDSRAMADARRLRQILLNLLSNAIKYSPEQGEIRILVHLLDNDQIRIAVEDRGPGVPAEHRDRIFDEFYQSDHLRDSGLGGSGIGLALVKKLVALHGGAVGYLDRPTGGSCFWFTLTATGEEIPALPNEFSPGQVCGSCNDARILVVDDIETNLFLVTEALTARGHVIDVARNGKEAIERAVEFNPELILMDMQMPVMDGLQATQKLKAMPQFSDIPIIALTASVSDDAIAECINAGCSIHLGKPIQLGMLFECVDNALAGRLQAPPAADNRAGLPPEKLSLRILIAEDNEMARNFMAEFFRRTKDSVGFAVNGREAVEMAVDGPFDLVLMDIQMPELNGIEATRAIRRHKDGYTLPIVGLSGLEERDDVEACIAAGMNEFITKPVRFARVLEVLDTYRKPAAESGAPTE